jgi:hypothetical protein
MPIKADMVMMRDGKMMVKRRGRITPMKEDLAIFDGTRVMMDGTVMMTDGIARTMMEGEVITMDGRITDMETKDEAS